MVLKSTIFIEIKIIPNQKSLINDKLTKSLHKKKKQEKTGNVVLQE